MIRNLSSILNLSGLFHVDGLFLFMHSFFILFKTYPLIWYLIMPSWEIFWVWIYHLLLLMTLVHRCLFPGRFWLFWVWVPVGSYLLELRLGGFYKTEGEGLFLGGFPVVFGSNLGAWWFGSTLSDIPLEVFRATQLASFLATAASVWPVFSFCFFFLYFFQR